MGCITCSQSVQPKSHYNKSNEPISPSSNVSLYYENENESKNKINMNTVHAQKEKTTKVYNLNILYYDEHLRDSRVNSDNCSFIEMNTNGTFYGCHYFELFKIVIEKLVKSKKEFILLSSGSSAQKIFDYCSDIKQIREYYIYCYLKDKYIPLMNKYTKLKGIYNEFGELKKKLYTINEIQMNNITSSNFIFF